MAELHNPPSTYILRELHDVAVPESVSWLPQTIGWKTLAVLGVALLMYWLYRKAIQWWVNRYRSEAIRAILQLQSGDVNQPQELFSILKIVLIYLDNTNGPLYEEKFLQKLDELNPNGAYFDDDISKRWVKSVFNPTIQLEPSECLLLTKRAITWVKHHDNKVKIPTLLNTVRRCSGGDNE
ncbi:DUF4381 domain-containing protein [Vibrio hepatarius]|uniref:DUF4381 domain-containing protein n=1 Tax=Vibrio hepatarius TaxID=171383 RepID=UPI001C08DD48|nr:DUF4381 domain-containing protein [Vibrio hepatarius]MBU2899080.1 DUF4381 domain-containing protein [Vibrio hepatarius]